MSNSDTTQPWHSARPPIAGLKVLFNLRHGPLPWDDLWRAIAAEHPFRDAWWEDRNLLPLLDRIEIPVYLGCDWQNVPLQLPHTFAAYERLTNSRHLQIAMLGEHGLALPWGKPSHRGACLVRPMAQGTRYRYSRLPLHHSRGRRLANQRYLAYA